MNDYGLSSLLNSLDRLEKVLEDWAKKENCEICRKNKTGMSLRGIDKKFGVVLSVK